MIFWSLMLMVAYATERETFWFMVQVIAPGQLAGAVIGLQGLIDHAPEWRRRTDGAV